MQKHIKWLIQLAAVLALALAAGSAQAQKRYGPGVTDTEIKIGNTNPYSGPASAYGTIGRTIKAYFEKINKEQGGINGRKITFITLDDSYSPPKTVEQVRKLVERERVLLVFQSLGTPTNSAIHKYMNKKKVPHLFVATGATKWNDPKNYPWTMGWQPNYQTEGRIYAKYILDNVKNPKIGVLYQNDDYGKDYVKGLKDGLGPAQNNIVALESYEVSDPTVDAQVLALKNSGANVFLNVTTPKFAAQSIRKAYDLGWKPTHLLNNVSTSVSRVMKPAGLEKSAGIISSAYLKEPDDPEWANDKGMLEWRAFMKAYYPDGDLSSNQTVYGYGAAKTMEHVLRMAGDDLTRENIMKKAASVANLENPVLLPGIRIDTNANDFAPIEQMQLMKFNGEGWERFGPVISAGAGS